ncbi:MAG TPA: carbamoyl-phosphate synthase large subunit, partial [Solirubrobacterales bacterium]|nr:carbamoyl-phosphate synthase large subunit [Solirubrobacterales bacterium]
EAFLKAAQGREEVSATLDLSRLGEPVPERWDLYLEGARHGLELPGIHPYFAAELHAIAAAEYEVAADGDVGRAKRFGLPDETIARVLGVDEAAVRRRRPLPGRLAVDSCAAEFEARTPYYYLSYEPSDEPTSAGDGSILILGSGPNRIGQGIEFDYCCVHAAQAFRALGYEAVLLNSNPETVSTDYDTSDRLYLEPVTLERVLDVCALERPAGVAVGFGGQTPLALAGPLADAGAVLVGDPLPAIEAAEDRGRFAAVLDQLGLRAPAWGEASTAAEAAEVAERIGYPVLVRPHYVIGGRGMRLARGPDELELGGPALVDEFLEGALELDVDCLCDGEHAWVAAILEHVEAAGVHSGDSACVVPAPSVTPELESEIRRAASALAGALSVRGLLNLQLALRGRELYVLEANPRASRTVPFVSKAVGAPLAKIACRLMLGESLADQSLPDELPSHISVKEAVLPFARFAGADSVLGPEMRSTGEVMGIAADFPTAFGKAQAAAGVSLPQEGTIFISVTDSDKPAATQLATRFHDLGFKVIATAGTAQAISAMGVPVTKINKIGEGSPHVVDCINSGEVDLVINTPTGSGARADGYEIRTAAVRHGVPCVTTMTGASAASRAIFAAARGDAEVLSLQELHQPEEREPSQR